MLDRVESAAAADAAAHVRRLRDALPGSGAADQLRSIEAEAAARYWGAWAGLPVRWARRDADKVPDLWRTFGARSSPLSASARRGQPGERPAELPVRSAGGRSAHRPPGGRARSGLGRPARRPAGAGQPGARRDRGRPAGGGRLAAGRARVAEFPQGGLPRDAGRRLPPHAAAPPSRGRDGTPMGRGGGAGGRGRRAIACGARSVRVMAEATGLSQGYCWFVRRGQKVPHRRHWAALARLEPVMDFGDRA